MLLIICHDAHQCDRKSCPYSKEVSSESEGVSFCDYAGTYVWLGKPKENGNYNPNYQFKRKKYGF